MHLVQKKIFLTTFTFLVFSTAFCFAKSTKTCAMVLYYPEENKVNEIVELVYGEIETALTQRDDLKIIDRSKVESVKKEHDAQQSEWAKDTEQVAYIGQQLGAELLCFVNVYKDTYKIEFLNVNTFQKINFTGNYSKELLHKRVKVKSLKDLKKLKLDVLTK